jgi:ABC-type nitrate/sulfonate/bicarbonate transport system permease component
MKKNLYFKILQTIPFVIFLILWQWYVHGADRRMFLFSSPAAVGSALLKGFQAGYLLYDT